MSDLLIDTHILLWLNFSPEKLSTNLLEQLQDKNHRVSVSVISFWEISLKYQLGKLNLCGVLPQDILSATQQMGIETAALAPEVFTSFYQLPLLDGHKDPFDRLIIWQCIAQNKILVSHDAKLKDYTDFGLKIWAS
jgi:PIN domain nuclease of toxin-antitoxin system